MPNVKTGAQSPTLPDALRLKITYRKVADLKPYAGNARTGAVRPIRTSLYFPANALTYAAQSNRHSARATARFSLKFRRE